MTQRFFSDQDKELGTKCATRLLLEVEKQFPENYRMQVSVLGHAFGHLFMSAYGKESFLTYLEILYEHLKTCEVFDDDKN